MEQQRINNKQLELPLFRKIENRLINVVSSNGTTMLRISIVIIFFWFGILKYFNGLSPAEGIAVKTISVLSFDLLSREIILYALATLEVLISLGLIFKANFNFIVFADVRYVYTYLSFSFGCF